MEITRRRFLKYCIGSAAALGLDLTVVGHLKEALAGDASLSSVIWIEGSSCSGCTVALMNLNGYEEYGGPTDVYDFLENYLNVAFAKTIMSAAGDLAVANLKRATEGKFVLVIEGGVPTEFDGRACTLYYDEKEPDEDKREVTMQQAVLDLAKKASHVICVGTCAAYGGVPAAGSNPTGVKSVDKLLADELPESVYNDISINKLINLPGCPAHPDWMVGTIVTALCGGTIDKDADSRPLLYYGGEKGTTVHDVCPRKSLLEFDANGNEVAKYDTSYATDFGQKGRCMLNLGCCGKETYADCPVRLWNPGSHSGGTNCIDVNGICIGCVERDFPSDKLIVRP